MLVDGVADYARNLAAALDANERVTSSFLCGDPQDSLGDGPWRDRAIKVGERSPDAVVMALGKLGSSTALLHYVGYGYAARGCPFWLVRGLERWKQVNSGARLVTMFHELYAFGPPWRSSFWLSPVQRALARRVWNISDGAATNVGRSERRLRDWRPGEHRFSLMPVFSNVGEPEELSPWSARRAQLVVLGRPDVAVRAYRNCREQLAHACRALEIREIIDIGARTEPVPSRMGNVTVSALGHLPAADVSTVLRKVRAGFLHYPSDHLGKSTVFAAYAAHGVVPVISWRRGEEEPGLAEGRNYWTPSVSAPGLRDFESIAGGALAWYAGHRLDIQARAFAEKLRAAPSRQA